ncbi:hypothetical protein AQI95_35955 [Streptomyces yokosukanensis]|uniref:Uncharacterized protein n=1 Tax=Streptomyces yokosukanensis TaxID=67386 RepID=A0A101NV38_9ACTN|nr:hypothetical protein [Streptomyces yokosukanensis]KUM99913.1 hypothetical protein AQI95_35955 [Streptomyces yokosukanensis]
MPHPTPNPARLAEDIGRQIGQLAHLLAQAPPHQAAQLLGAVLDAETGVLTQVTELIGTGSRFAKDHSERGLLPPEVWLALGRAANDLERVGTDLDEHTDTIRSHAHRPRPAGSPAPQPVASALVVRRRR